MSHDAEVSLTPPRYARFSRRVRGMMLDLIIILIVIAATLRLQPQSEATIFPARSESWW
jgi:hypothetical protein